jgi:hypothetical protein
MGLREVTASELPGPRSSSTLGYCFSLCPNAGYESEHRRKDGEATVYLIGVRQGRSPQNGGWPRSRRPKSHPDGAPGPSRLGTGETPNPNWQEEAHGLAESIPTNAQGPRA